MKTIFSLIVVLRLVLTVSVLALGIVPVAPSVGHAATCTAGLNAAYTDGDYLFLNKANLTSVFQISTGTWVRQVDLDSLNIPAGRQTVTSPDFYACGIAHVNSNELWFMRLDWYTNRCYR